MNDDDERPLFKKSHGGGFDWQRMVEQAVPGLIIGAVVIYANNLVTQNQVSDLRSDMKQTIERYNSYNIQFATLNAQVATYLQQQGQFNSQMDARMTYIERGLARR